MAGHARAVSPQMALIYVRSILAIVLCRAGGLAYWFGFSAIVRRDAFGVPFGWGFGPGAVIGGAAVPLVMCLVEPRSPMLHNP
jgi:hypothetical protein